jgi:hypothetical protein
LQERAAIHAEAAKKGVIHGHYQKNHQAKQDAHATGKTGLQSVTFGPMKPGNAEGD